MIWQTAKAYWKRISAIILGVGAVLGMLWGASGYVFAVDDWVEVVDAGVVVAQVADTKADEALEWQRLQVQREQMEAQQEREKWRKVVELCLAGIITDQKVCAEATAALK